MNMKNRSIEQEAREILEREKRKKEEQQRKILKQLLKDVNAKCRELAAEGTKRQQREEEQLLKRIIDKLERERGLKV